ncbi:hypothetical protein ASPSYDRAFT_85159 [Aspergillus sydowii CBS 593.65]|uniref:Uncharacterized protein n=1 Tax=Aspergillus sydowii CBS 593.65 TaxID=1036612 RepID=A0A1L9U0H4_9EURO|nr:uncharacterized protein ASPSYDRAFT_85159 [Aspergillus sydowii CBS 593.65]OJJ65187.1 hypothetical protein ASPSYDRAFT_85159 [Aspergillus sydowii CBS 593.65]
MRTVREFRTLTGLQILDTPLPEIITREGYRTTSSAYHHLFYNGPLVHWPIETEAHDVVFAEKLNEHHLAVEMPGVANHPCSNTREQYICGDDADVYARFMQNALTPVAAVGFAQGIKTNFGNFRASEEYAEFKNRLHCPAKCLSGINTTLGAPDVKLAGEVKTGWNHLLEEFQAWSQDKNGEKRFRRALGQIARYMHIYGMAYGVLTT